ncbi:hypothetical protein SS50377_23567 [Spironucleus salmonicida]|uniref:Uncharacterized protein n=1 Tax=Spironucleus salmonicida TaxID=348837 RepID=V6M5B4_9EUKA|nr:hypothetical protein SS50377_23567 [Spironucleus salmonicida]|eukprot:EST48549.1 Hypothetical protein SS50377_11160 [Spironucleus salmonicida]
MDAEIQAQIQALGLTNVTPQEYEQIKRYVNQQSLTEISGLPPAAPTGQQQYSNRPASAVTSIEFLEQKRQENTAQQQLILNLYTNENHEKLKQNQGQKPTIQCQMEDLLKDFIESPQNNKQQLLKPIEQKNQSNIDQVSNFHSEGEDYQDDALTDYYCFMDKKKQNQNYDNMLPNQSQISSQYDTFQKPSSSATISKFMPTNKSTMKEKQKRKSDPVNNYLAYQSRWNIQGAPQERKQRIQKSKVEDIVGEFLLRNNATRK